MGLSYEASDLWWAFPNPRGDSILENVYDILHKENLMFLLPSDVKNCDVPEDVFACSAVAVNLYYEDTLDRYFSYLENIPESVDVYIFRRIRKPSAKYRIL